LLIHESRIIHPPHRYVTRFPHALWRGGCIALSLMLIVSATAVAQTIEPDSASTNEINSIEFIGDSSFDASTLKEILSLRETPSGFSKFIYRNLSEKLGSRPEYFTQEKFDADLSTLKTFYQEHGYYETEVQGTHTLRPDEARVDIIFFIKENEVSKVDSVRYLGIDSIAQETGEEIYRNPILQKGMVYEAPKGGLEVARVLNILVNHGYPGASFDVDHSASYHRRATHTFNLTYVFKTGKLRKFGEITIHVDPPREDIVDHLTLRQLDFQPGDIYSRSKKISSESNLNRLGLFESARIDHPAPAESVANEMIPIDIYVKPRPRNEFSPEIIASDENNAFNLGLGIGYTNRNFFGDARSFSAHLSARTQTIKEFFTGARLRDTVFVGATTLDFEILQPYLFTRTLSGSWTTTIEFDKQKDFILSILRNRVGVSNRFALYTTGYVDWTLERVSTELINPSTSIEAINKQLRIDEQPQFNSIITFTLQRDKTNDVFSPTEGFFHSISLEESGVLPKLFNGLAGGLPFTQYYKTLLSGRWYEDLGTSRFNILAWKLKGGYQEKYGESKYKDVIIPLNRKFFSGGSGSVRGWRARELGHMSDELLPYGGDFMLEGTAEMRVNHFRGFGKLGFIRMDAIWMVYFMDIGSVWSSIRDFHARDVGVAAGIGFRYDTFFGPFRLDFGFKLYDPKEEPGHQTVFEKKFLSETLSSGVLHFGIGQAF